MNNLTELVFIIDKSGSMAGLEADTIGGINATLEENRGVAGDANVSLVLFADDSEVVLDRVPIEGVRPLTRRDYRVGGCTALLDATAEAIAYHKKVQKSLPKDRRADHVVFVIITDGQENASRRHTYAEVKKLITKATKKHGWEFLFLGANIDAAAEAARIGIAADRASRYVSDGTGSQIAYEAVSAASRDVRTCGAPRVGWAAAPMRDAYTRG